MPDPIGRDSPLDRLPETLQALQVLQGFKSVRTPDEFRKVSERWSVVRPKLKVSESELACGDSGAASDREIARGVVEDLVDAPVELIVSLAQLVLAFSGSDKDEFLPALKKTYEEAVKAGLDVAKGKMEKESKAALDKAYQTLRESLLHYLQSVSKRSRKHFSELIDAAAGTLKGLGGAVASSTKLFFTPTKITPEWCGLLNQIDTQQDIAMKRVFSDTSLQKR